MEHVQEKYELYDLLSIGICVINKDYQVVFWNTTMEEWTGVMRNEILDQQITKFFPDFADPLNVMRIDFIFSCGPPVILSSKLHKTLFPSKKSILSDAVHEIKIFSNRSPVCEQCHAVISVEDVTDLTKKINSQKELYLKAQEEIETRKQVEKSLTDSEAKLKDSLTVNNKLLSIVGHDLKNWFNILIGMSDVLNANWNIINQEEIQSHINSIQSASKNGLQVLNNLLHWALSQSGQIDTTPAMFNLHQLFIEVTEQLEPKAIEKNIRLSINISEPLEVYANRRMIEIVLRNLISNSLKFTEENGSILVNALQFGDLADISVQDTGIGIRPEVISKLLDEKDFYTTGGTNKEKGTGLGVSLCKDFIEKSGGKLYIESQPGSGSTFSFSLPLKPH